MHTPQPFACNDYVYISHDKYRRLVRYSRGFHLPYAIFQEILSTMDDNTRSYFYFHNNPARDIVVGSYLNGHASLAVTMYRYFNARGFTFREILNGQDFFIHIID